MSVKTYTEMSVDELIDEFIRLAKSLSSLWTFWFKTPKKTPEREEMKQELRAIGAELCARKPIEKLRALFDHESVDVRFHAVWAFMAVDPDWALATISAHREDLATKDVIALRARAKKRPPARPTVKEMSTDQLAARFEDAATREYATQFLGGQFEPYDVKLRNRIVDEIRGIADELKSRDALPSLLPLLDHANVTVRNSAAIYCLDVAPERALPALEAIAAGQDKIEAVSASWAIDRWREEQSKPGSP
jgi:HEAT repeat protein